jgi:tRNA threonylcarbamoyladenosine biosynthesis protein TsaB
MKLLAIETSSIACSVALQLGRDVVEQHIVEPKAHTRVLMPMIRSVLDDAGLKVSELDALVLGNGPGSFIGMRIGASVAQGLAFAAGLNIVPVSSLAAVAAEVFSSHSATHVAVAQDARMNQVYLGCFVRDDDGLPTAVCDERINDLEKIQQFDVHPGTAWLAAGAGWQQYPSLAAMQEVKLEQVTDVLTPRAVYLLGIAGKALDAGGSIAPETLRPAYLRDKVAAVPGSK